MSHCVKFVGILYRDAIADHWDLSAPTPKPQNYLIKTFDDKYYKWLNVLLEYNVVIRSTYYSPISHECYTYCVNPIYQTSILNPLDNSTTVLCKEKYINTLNTVVYKDVVKDETDESSMYRTWFIEDFNKLNINYESLEEIIINHINDLTIDEFIIHEELLPPSIKLSNENNKGIYFNTKKALSNLKSGEVLIKDGTFYKIVRPIEFIQKKKSTMLFYHRNSIERLRNNCFNVKRNCTNNRLDTNFTNLSSTILEAIRYQNNLVEIDLSNSQFTILSKILEENLDTEDFKRFKNLSTDGKLYDFISEKLVLKNARNAKQIMFEVMFSSYRYTSNFKDKIKELFPSVVQWINNYKRLHGDNEFCIMLQKKESEIFIDNIFLKLKNQGLMVFSKHDSLMVKYEDLSIALDTIKSELSFGNLEYRLKISTNNGQYYINSKDVVIKEVKSELKNEYYSNYTKMFKYSSSSTTLTPAQFYQITGQNHNLIPISKIVGKLRNYNKDGFEVFWSDWNNLSQLIHL